MYVSHYLFGVQAVLEQILYVQLWYNYESENEWTHDDLLTSSGPLMDL